MAFVARIYVTPRADVLDPQGKAVGQALHSLGFGEVGDVHVGRYMVVELEGADRDEAEARVGAMCERLLANPVVEDYRFELTAVEAGA
ncbi:MAG: phosphoribosylformylglycinamidine synthase subunit PurS [Myxococcota bacterium]